MARWKVSAAAIDSDLFQRFFFFFSLFSSTEVIARGNGVKHLPVTRFGFYASRFILSSASSWRPFFPVFLIYFRFIKRIIEIALALGYE